VKRLKLLTGSGNKFGLIIWPLAILGFILYFIFPSFFSIPQSNLLIIFGLIFLYSGIIVCIWSQILIFIKVPKKQLITKGPYALVQCPLYTGVSLLVLPGLGFLLDNWLLILFGFILYIVTRMYKPEEEKRMKKEFGKKYEKYLKSVLFPWL
jgi:protein-S-isoprenylcysteine O-methyltransferase Ste14